MANFDQEIKKAMNHSMNKESVFSEIEKQKVRHKINQMPTNKTKVKRHLFPKALTGVAVAGFMLFIGGVIGSNLELGESPFSNKNGSTQAEQQKSFYEGLIDGDQLNGWTLLNKGLVDEAKSNSSGVIKAVFQGEATITGSLKYFDENEKMNAGRLLFVPYKDYLAFLPLEKDVVPEIEFNFEDQEQIRKVFGIASSITLDNITLTINGYTAMKKEGLDLPHLVSLDKIILPTVEEIQTRPVNLLVNNDQELYLPSKLQPIYQEYSKTKDDGLLRDLSPFEVFQLYFYAEEQEDYETQYALFIHDEMYIKVFETYEEYLDAIVNPPFPIKEEDKLLSKIKIAVLEERVISEDSASISIGVNNEEGLGFGLTKNSIGVWKINWLPIQ